MKPKLKIKLPQLEDIPALSDRVFIESSLARRHDAVLESITVFLHNNGASLAANTQGEDVEWLANNLYHSVSTFGMGDVRTIDSTLPNEDFERLKLKPDRQWTGKRWETLSEDDRQAWLRLAKAVLCAIPGIAERIGHRWMTIAKAARVQSQVERKNT